MQKPLDSGASPDVCEGDGDLHSNICTARSSPPILTGPCRQLWGGEQEKMSMLWMGMALPARDARPAVPCHAEGHRVSMGAVEVVVWTCLAQQVLRLLSHATGAPGFLLHPSPPLSARMSTSFW